MTKIPILIIALASSLVHANPVSYTCPQKIIASSTADSTEVDWESFGIEKTPHRYLHSFIMASHPRNLGQLKPWNADAKGKKFGDIYKLEGAEPNGYWLQCVYADTTAGYAKRLPDGIDRCELKNPKGPMVCK